jgi:hypothetical protein
MQQREPFRLADVQSDARRAENQKSLMHRYLGGGVSLAVPTCTSCGKPRVLLGRTHQGFARVGHADGSHALASPPEFLFLSWPGAEPGEEAREFNDSVAYALDRGLDAPARFKGCVAGPCLPGGAVVHTPYSPWPVYPLAMLAKDRRPRALFAEIAALSGAMWQAVLDLRDAQRGVGRAPEPVPEPDPQPVAPRNRPALRVRLRRPIGGAV